MTSSAVVSLRKPAVLVLLALPTAKLIWTCGWAWRSVPSLEAVVQEFGVALPLPTVLLLGTYRFWVVAPAVAVAAIAWFARRERPAGRDAVVVFAAIWLGDLILNALVQVGTRLPMIQLIEQIG